MNKKRLVSSIVTSAAVWISLATANAQEIFGPIEIETAFRGESAPLTELAAMSEAELAARVNSGQGSEARIEMINYALSIPRGKGSGVFAGERGAGGEAKALQTVPGSAVAPAPGISFDGTSDDDNAAQLGFRIVPPDTNGDVGKQYYAQMNNLVFEIFDKKTGNSVLGPLPNNIFFTNTGGMCDIFNDGDPIVLYDQQAKRWIFSQFAILDADGNSHQCFAISKTKDPLGEYWLYDFVVSTPIAGGLAAINDYPKLGVWRDGIYASSNDFEFFSPPGGFFFVAASAQAFDKNAMYQGQPANAVRFVVPFTGNAPVIFSLMPGHWEGNFKPKKGQPNPFVQAFDDDQLGDGTLGDGYFVFDFDANFKDVMNSTFGVNTFVTTEDYDFNFCNGSRNCISQPSPGTQGEGNGLDPVDFRVMNRAQWRGFNNNDQRMVFSHGVVNGPANQGSSPSAVRWVEIKSPDRGGSWTLEQEGNYAPADGDDRFMPSVAQDRKGNIAVGYTVSSQSTYPSVRYATRSRSDAPGELGTEESCFEGTGSQINSFNRWGDYSSMSVDPVDECTFWYTNEYYETDSAFNFKTRICSFKMDNCGGKK